MCDSKSVSTRIAMIVTDYDSVNGGLQIISRNLIKELNRKGVETFICCRNYNDLPSNDFIGGTSIHRSAVSKLLPSVFNSISFFLSSLWWLIRNRRKYDVIHCQQIFAPAMIGAFIKIFLSKPFIVGVHSTGSWGEVNQLRNSPLRILLLKCLKMANFVVVLNPEMHQELESVGVQEDKIRFIPNGTKIPEEAAFQAGIRQKYRQKLDLHYEQFAVFTGRLSAEKGLDVLIRAWTKVFDKDPDVHLLIVGKGGGFPDVEQELIELCHELGLEDRVHFLGFQRNPLDYLLAADVFVLSSNTEGFGMSILEAMACGTPVVATATSGAKLLIQGDTGKLVPVAQPIPLANAIVEILERPELAQKLGRAARERAVKDYSIEIMGERFLKLYVELQTNH